MSQYPVNSYVPKKVDFVYDLHSRLNQMKYDEILNDVDGYFKNCYITNFDLINHNCRGDKLNYSRKFYQTIFENDLNENLNLENKYNFCSSAIKSERKDLFLEKKVYNNHFKEDLESKGIFLSSMRKRAFFKKKTEDCKLKF